MKKFLALAALISVSAASSFADTLATWTFETDPLAANYTPGANTATTNFFADAGVQAGTAAATGLHSGSATYSSPSGNGSTKSLNVNTWAVGDYWQFQLSTVGYNGLSLSFDQTSSGTGPRDFNLSYSLNGTTFTQIGSTFIVNSNAAPNPTWNITTSSSLYTYSYDLGSSVDNSGTVFFRITDADTTSAGGGTVAASGTDRIDNFSVFTTAVPEPSAVAFGILGGLAGLVAWKRRR
jgi:hypothetical protein